MHAMQSQNPPTPFNSVLGPRSSDGMHETLPHPCLGYGGATYLSLLAPSHRTLPHPCLGHGDATYLSLLALG
ncbi:unnamed protein product [Sphenostylis stenocarpa]|uniref:Uncharacterized protein n=1 Tax=Sphenostylis stenocarpa TaxID=92480 RepID=A0AA86SLR7_9FABA|nr:unnamed protein product [Sphenostylis stenocarpa]